MILNSPIIRFFLIFFLSVTLVSLTTEANDSYGIIQGGKGLIYIVNVISTILYAVYMAKLDAGLVITSHWSRVAYRFLLLTIVPGILAIQHSTISPLALAFMNYSIFYFLFEIVYDDIRKENPFSIGTTAWNDKIVNWLNTHLLGKIFPAWYVGLKISLIVLAQFLVMKFYF